MKILKTVLVLSLLVFACKTQEPQTAFNEDALTDTFISINDENITVKNILDKHKGKTVLIDVWASWCGDCIKGMPKVKALQQQFPEVDYLFFSADKNTDSWKRGIKKHNVEGEHYFMPKGMKSAFSKSIDLDWIPRYMVVDKNGNIKLFRAITADDKELINILKNQ